MAENYQAPAELSRYRTIALGVGGIALIIWAVGTYFNIEQGLRSWLLGFIFWGGITFGGIGITMLQYLTGGAWGVVIRRIVEAASRVLPLVFIMWLPLAVGVTYLYEWTHLPPDDFTVQHRGAYQTPLWWIVRGVVYFALLGLMVFLLNDWSARQDKSADHEEAAKWLGRATAFSGPTMVIYVLVITFATVDWVMSLDPHWFSTIWGLLFVVGWALSTFCFSILIFAIVGGTAPMNRVLGKRHFHDIGKLILALVMVWAYFNFSQLLIIYSGNIPEETGWYLVRMSTGWFWVGMILVLFHFAFPYLFLLRQDWKKNIRMLGAVSLFILVMRLVDMFFLISPNPRISTHGESLPLSLSFSWMDIVAPIAVGGIWLWYFFGQLMSRPLVPVMDPFLENAIKHGHGH
jgi:hypothetical protein